MSSTPYTTMIDGLNDGSVVPVLGPDILKGVVNTETGDPLPTTSDELIIALNRGRPMAPKLMYEFSRAAMHVEFQRGRKAIEKFLTDLYEQPLSRAPVHDWIGSIKPRYVIDMNRDRQLQASYSDTPHLLVLGIARLGGNEYRFRLFRHDGTDYSELEPTAEVDVDCPILFKAMGSPYPFATYIAADADYVDFITELMGGFGMPKFLKEYRMKKRYLFMGLPLERDTERMIVNDMIYGAPKDAGWAFIKEPTKKESKFCSRHGIEIVEADIDEALEQLMAATAKAA